MNLPGLNAKQREHKSEVLSSDLHIHMRTVALFGRGIALALHNWLPSFDDLVAKGFGNLFQGLAFC